MAKRYTTEQGYDVSVGAKRNGMLRSERAYTIAEARRIMRAAIKQGAAIVYIHNRMTGVCVDASE
jgi:hypothetical protein